MICKDNETYEIYITFYEENKKNNIDFWLSIENEKERKKHLNLILSSNLFVYLELINFNYNDDKKEIFDDEGNKVGFFIRNCEINRSKYLLEIKSKYLGNNFNEYKNLKLQEKNMVNIELIPKVNSILICLNLFNELVNEIYNYSQKNNFKITKYYADFFQAFRMTNDYDKEIKAISGPLSLDENIHIIFNEIINSIDNEFCENLNIEINPKIEDLDENIGKKKFLEKHSKGSIIQQLFFSILKTKANCSKCKLKNYIYQYSKFVKIDLNVEKDIILLT